MWLTATMQFWSSSWKGLLELCVRLFFDGMSVEAGH